MRPLAAYIMRGRMQAISAACALAVMSWVIPFLSLLAAAAVGLPTLRKGAYEGGIIIATSIAALGALGGSLSAVRAVLSVMGVSSGFPCG